MPDRPIIFSAPMIRALIGGRKTQTRRVLRPQPVCGAILEAVFSGDSGEPLFCQFRNPGGDIGKSQSLRFAPGDRLWVREAHAISANPDRPVWYRAGHEEARAAGPRVDVRWRPSIHMPRWASRFTLIVEAVKIERLQDISAEDVTAEGIRTAPNSAIDLQTGAPVPGFYMPEGGFSNLPGAHLAAYGQLWAQINGDASWRANPFVTAITFRPIRANIDALDAEARPLVSEEVTP